MNVCISTQLIEILICPNCKSKLKYSKEKAFCKNCTIDYPLFQDGKIDLRLRKNKKYSQEFDLGNELVIPDNLKFEDLPINKTPEVDYKNINVPKTLN